jgi:hypothetical protein
MKGLDWRVTAALGAALWGSWALYANWEAGVGSASLSAVTQAAISASSITFLSLLANRVLARSWPNPVVQVVAATVIPYSVLLSLVITAHLIVGTHNIVRTIVPSASVGIAYCVLYAIKNRRMPTP